MKATELIHGGYYRIHDASDITVRYDACSHSFKSQFYEYPMEMIRESVCAKEDNRLIYVHRLPLIDEMLNANGFEYEEGFWGIGTSQFTHLILRYIHPDDEHRDMEEDAYEYYVRYWVIDEDFRIKYVHELQSALRLLGLGELADNFILNAQQPNHSRPWLCIANINDYEDIH